MKMKFLHKYASTISFYLEASSSLFNSRKSTWFLSGTFKIKSNRNVLSEKVGVSPEQRQSTKSNTSTKIQKVLENLME